MDDLALRWFAFTDEAMTAALALRYEVFVIEQSVPLDLEVDEDDVRANHLGAYLGDVLAGTLRVVITNGRAKVGRVAVTLSVRKRGIGGVMMNESLRFASSRGCTIIELAAQCDATAFYERLGFAAHGEPFDDAGIPHIHMERPLTT
jgi:predicted GNAT family N-acyltransferase